MQTGSTASGAVWSNRTAILWRDSLEVEYIDQFFYSNGRITGVLFSLYGRKYRLAAVYVPVQDGEKSSFFDDLNYFLTTWYPEHSLIIGGDWNCVENPYLDSVIISPLRRLPTDRWGARTQELAANHQMLDSYRIKRPRGKDFTNRHACSCRRLDRIYIPVTWYSSVRKIDIVQGAGSTHLMYLVKLELGSAYSGPPTYRFNASWLEYDWFCNEIRSMIRKFLENEWKAEDPIISWDNLKHKLRDRLILSSMKANTFRRVDPELDKQMTFRGLRIKVRYPPFMSFSNHFDGMAAKLEYTRDSGLLRDIITGEGNIRAADILNMAMIVRQHFSGIYTTVDTDPNMIDQLFDSDDPHYLTPETAELLDRPFTVQELYKAARDLSTSKTPGPDGIPVEIYTTFWELLGDKLASVLEYSCAIGELPQSHKMSFLTLVPKKGDSRLLDNWRSIALLNADYKILTQAMNKRLGPVLEKTLSQWQHGFIPNRKAEDAIHNLEALIHTDFGQLDKEHGCLLFVDFVKAYDKVAHVLIKEVLHRYSFGPRTRNMIQATIEGTKAHVRFNGWLTSSIKINSGVRQADPLSPLVFAMILEPLTRLLTQRLDGVKVAPSAPVYTFGAFADDLHIVITQPQEARTVCRILSIFDLAGGGKVNLNKSFLSGFSNPPEEFILGVQQILPLEYKRRYKYLGAEVGPTVYEREWVEMQIKLSRRLRFMTLGGFTIRTRAWLINTFVYSALVYLDSIHPAPEEVIKKIETEAIQMLWGGKHRLHLVSQDLLKALPSQGGFGLWNLQHKLAGARAKHLRDLFSPSKQVWPHALRLQAHALENWNSSILEVGRMQFVEVQKRWFISFFNPRLTIKTVLWRKWTAYRQAFFLIFPTVSLTATACCRIVTNQSENPVIPRHYLNSPEPFNDTKYTATHKRLGQRDPGSKSAEWWLVRWRNLTNLAKKYPDQAEVAQLLALRRILTQARFERRWIYEHAREGLQDPLNCQMCQVAPETIAHMFWECPNFQQVLNKTDYVNEKDFINGPLDPTEVKRHAFLVYEWYELHRKLRYDQQFQLPEGFERESYERYKMR